MEKENMFPVAYIGKQIVSLPMFYAMNENGCRAHVCGDARGVGSVV